MPAKVQIRAYNVEFGDCVLLSVDDAGTRRHVLFDFGNVAGKGGPNVMFGPVAQDIQKTTQGTLDLVVMTHEHLDHMEGFYHQRKIFDHMTIRRVWMSVPSAPDYYEKHPKSKKAFAAAQRLLTLCQGHFEARGVAPQLLALLQNNLSNKDRVDYLRRLPVKKRTHYLCRGMSTQGKHDFQAVQFRILAPEREMSLYYGDALRLAEGIIALRRRVASTARRFAPPAHISTTEFERLRASLQAGDIEAVHQIDKAENNTSLVLLVEVAGKRLLFAGDAEEKSWQQMHKHKLLKPVDFLKVSHHGSWNGTPDVNSKNVVEILFPKNSGKRGIALVSTKSHVYGTANPVPDEATLQLLGKRCSQVYSTEKDAKGKLYLDIEL